LTSTRSTEQIYPPARLRSPGRDHLGTPGDIISDCLGDFVGICTQGAKAVKGVPARHENLKAEIAQLGGRLVGGYVTRGQYDVVLVLEMPDGDAMTKLAVALISRGNVRTTTVRAHSMEDFGKLAAEVI
jgi:uncharacterized protein with GYD domain